MKTRLALWSAAAVLAPCAVLLILWAPQIAYAAGPWYVAPGGNDLSDCLSAATPCGTINGAIGKASAGDTIFVATGTYTGTVDNVVSIDRDITLSGGWDSTFAQQTGLSTIDGQGARRGIFNMAWATIDHFLLQGGRATQTGGRTDGGGLLSLSGSVTLNHCIVRANTATTYGSAGGGIASYGFSLILNDTVVISNAAAGGGGIYEAVSNVTINGSSITGNQAVGAGGGGILAIAGGMSINNSTIGSNTASIDGGGINWYYSSNSLSIRSSTITDNSATNGGGLAIYDSGGYISTVRVHNTLVAGNHASNGPDCQGSLTSSDYNLIGDPSTCTGLGSTDLVNVNPRLGPLTGSPGYYPLLFGSPAVNGGNPSGCVDTGGNPLQTDQRGMLRVGRCDIGAYENQLPYAALGALTVSQPALLQATPLTYSIVLANTGTDLMPAVVVTDVIPSSLVYDGLLSSTSGTASFDNGSVTWSGVIDAVEAITITFGANVSADAPAGVPIPDAAVIDVQGNQFTLTAVVTPLSLASVLGSSAMTVSDAFVSPGSLVTYSIALTNTGSFDLANVVLTNTLPAALTYQAGSLGASSGSYGYANGTVSWSGSMPAGQGFSITYGAAVTVTAIGPIPNSAVISDGGETITRSATTTILSWSYLPALFSPPLPGIFGHVNFNGVSRAGVPLTLRFYNGSAWSTAATTTTDANGRYSFTGTPSLRSGQQYYVLFGHPEDGIAGSLGAWGTRSLTTYSSGTAVGIGDFDIGDIGLVAPANYAFVALPYTFQWTPRSAAPTDSYVLELWDPSNSNTYAYTSRLGYVGTLMVPRLPSGFGVNRLYAWNIMVFSPDGGSGLAYAVHGVSFTNTGAGQVSALGMAGLERGPLFDDLLAQHPRRVP